MTAVNAAVLSKDQRRVDSVGSTRGAQGRYRPDASSAPDGTDFAMLRTLIPAILSGGAGVSQLELDQATFAEVPSECIDYAVMEQADRVAVMRADIGWSDIGSGNALGEPGEPDPQGNRVRGDAMLYNSHGCTVHRQNPVVGAVGVDHRIIIDTPDALLVANKSRALDVKHIYAALKAKGHDANRLHNTVHRPWGTYTLREDGANFKIKHIEVKSGSSLSLQMHYHRSAHWVVVSGTAMVVNDEREFLLRPNESTYIPAGHRHRLQNPGVVKVVLIEDQSGEYLGEDDIVRLDDNYGRA